MLWLLLLSDSKASCLLSRLLLSLLGDPSTSSSRSRCLLGGGRSPLLSMRWCVRRRLSRRAGDSRGSREYSDCGGISFFALYCFWGAGCLYAAMRSSGMLGLRQVKYGLCNLRVGLHLDSLAWQRRTKILGGAMRYDDCYVFLLSILDGHLGILLVFWIIYSTFV